MYSKEHLHLSKRPPTKWEWNIIQLQRKVKLLNLLVNEDSQKSF